MSIEGIFQKSVFLKSYTEYKAINKKIWKLDVNAFCEEGKDFSVEHFTCGAKFSAFG